MSSRKGKCRIAAGSQPRRKQVSLGLSSHRGRATATSSFLGLEEVIHAPQLCRLALVCLEDQQSRCGWFISNPGERWLSLLRVGLTQVVLSLIRPDSDWGLWPQLCPQETTPPCSTWRLSAPLPVASFPRGPTCGLSGLVSAVAACPARRRRWSAASSLARASGWPSSSPCATP